MAGLPAVGSVTGLSGLASWSSGRPVVPAPPVPSPSSPPHAARIADIVGSAMPAAVARRRNSRRLSGTLLRNSGC